MVIGNNITSKNLITVNKIINKWQIASTSKKKKKNLKNTGQLDPTRNPTQPATRLTRNPIDPFWPVTRFDQWPDWPDPNPTRPARFAMSTYQGEVLPKLSFYNLYDLITLPCIMNFLFISKCYLTCNNTKEKRIQILYNIFCILYIEFSINCSMLCVFFFFFLFNITLLLFYNEIKKNKW